MAERKGTISVQTSDIFPIIKKWLYSEHDIFLRELTSNAADAITKRSTLARTQNLEVPPAQITVEINPEQKTLTIRDNGLGMSEAEVEKYIAQLAFSGAREFVEKMKAQGAETKEDIIGKFGLGFYSAFMVADKVEVNTLSMNPGAVATRWVCLGDTEYSFTDSDKSEVGTEVILHLNEDSQEFLDFYKTKEVLSRYCKFMNYPITLVDLKKEAEEKDKKEEEKSARTLINDTEPLWKKDPSTLKDEDYKNFYQVLFPYDQEPLFWLHLNVDHPFELRGILYFPKLNPSKPFSEHNISLYSKQVFVSDNVKNIIPEFLSLLKGVVDSNDIPLNVSRSSLQGDPNIKKISNYIIKKVAESLKKLFQNDRTRFEQVWEDISVFVKYGIISDTKFDELTRSLVLFKNVEGKLTTFEEYEASIPEQYKEKLKDKVIYFHKEESDVSLCKQLQAQGVQVVQTDSYIDPHFMQHVEFHKVNDKAYRFASVDSEVENILAEQNVEGDDLKIKDIFFDSLVPKEEQEKKKDQFEVEIKKFADAPNAAYFKIDENMKRMKRMTQSFSPNGQNDWPVKKTLVVNPSHPLVQNVLKIWQKGGKENLVKQICAHIQDLATLSGEGLSKEGKEQFVKRGQTLIEELTTLAL